MIARAFEDVAAADLDNLIANRVAEHRTLEYKRQLPGSGAEARREFLADISSFANAQGGDILFGIDAPRGIATAIHGADVDDRDKEQLSWENLLYAGVEPRLPGLRSRWIDCGARGHVFFIRVPASSIAPHRVIFGKSYCFYGRKSNGKYPMDTAELRQAFVASEALPVRLRALHMETVDAANRGEMPIGIGGDPRAILSLIPLTFFREAHDLDITPENALLPIHPVNAETIPMIEGILIHNIPSKSEETRSYALTHRTGRIDMVWTIGQADWLDDTPVSPVFADIFERGALDAANSGAVKLHPFGVEGPWQVLVTLSGIKGFELELSGGRKSDRAWRDEVTLPPLLVETMNRAAMLPLLRAFWLAFGAERPKELLEG